MPVGATIPWQPYQDANMNDDIYEPMEPEATQPDITTDFSAEKYDTLISAQVLLPKGDLLQPTIVCNKKTDHDGNPIGHYNTNPLLDTHVYEVAFPDGHCEEYAANIVAENIYSQVDPEDICFFMLIDHCKDNTAVNLNFEFTVMRFYSITSESICGD
jgi:hypothetical protein